MRVKGILTIKVWIDDAESLDDVRSQLLRAAEHLASAGMLAGDGPAVVDSWMADVDVKDTR
jgi:hypothetical protein